MSLYGIVGTGGFGREVLPMAREMLNVRQKDFQLVFIDEHKSKDLVNDYPVYTIAEFCQLNDPDKFFNIAIADAHIRKRIAEQLMQKKIKPFRIDAQYMTEYAANEIDEGAIFCPFTTVTSNVTIGRFFHANMNSYIAHDCRIGNFVTFAPNVICNGNVIIEDEAYIGAGAVIKQGLPNKPMVIGQGAVIGMGAIVTKSVPAFQTVIGNPARAYLKKLQSVEG